MDRFGLSLKSHCWTFREQLCVTSLCVCVCVCELVYVCVHVNVNIHHTVGLKESRCVCAHTHILTHTHTQTKTNTLKPLTYAGWYADRGDPHTCKGTAHACLSQDSMSTTESCTLPVLQLLVIGFLRCISFSFFFFSFSFFFFHRYHCC